VCAGTCRPALACVIIAPERNLPGQAGHQATCQAGHQATCQAGHQATCALCGEWNGLLLHARAGISRGRGGRPAFPRPSMRECQGRSSRSSAPRPVLSSGAAPGAVLGQRAGLRQGLRLVRGGERPPLRLPGLAAGLPTIMPRTAAWPASVIVTVSEAQSRPSWLERSYIQLMSQLSLADRGPGLLGRAAPPGDHDLRDHGRDGMTTPCRLIPASPTSSAQIAGCSRVKRCISS
jgi:hypothetical protein